ncbi:MULTISPECIES: DUF2119 domain-containing protein [Methanothermococcus]|uniref:DUF2119 domain-containing protein n=1 Tax=Methanothermococcus TaxID=155862 RepID=UPI000593D209|nr:MULTISPECIES: DUF2119 domain-containing protein [Methanothermococcus]
MNNHKIPYKHPTKLFIGGLHGDEGNYTELILEDLTKEKNYKGKVIIIPKLTENSKYVSTLHKEYYKTGEGKYLIDIIDKYKPNFYFELHSYSDKSYSKLTDPNRADKIGIPPFIDIGDRVLIASISPVLRNKFTQDDFCMTIEIPKWKVDQSKGRVLEILKMGLDSESRREMIERLEEKYPEQVRIARYLSKKYNLILF